ncbi:patatin-like phospholipase family protein [Shewanella sp. 10N.286.52.B9]|uniref:patatin-like phospholipase family protein n=1 Tax=Shewanella sp. 10N.286.52.B9 TaxID=1880837 RepID=UPI000C843556|nr:patatin-like phospholipase family protein [Shewanella sp. 10N.286.52.B9]PMG43347.1 phospholipase [Shewanella sp. 10N.286.52.B9]
MNTPKNLIKLIFFALFITACSSNHQLEQRVDANNYKDALVAADQTEIAEPYRFWADEQPAFLYDATTNTTPLASASEKLNILVLSGGGAKGAYGTGVINGLYDSNQLPQYTIVTGISAGSLIAPFAFIGGDEIHRLKQVMLGLNDKAILGKRNFLNALFKDAFTDGSSLYELVEQFYPATMIDKIATEHQKGRRLFIGTTQFDSGELMIWNIGQIAASNLPNKYDLVHQILAASSSIPGVFPPQFINVEIDGKPLEELHVDGGMNSQMFVDPGNFDYGLVNQALGYQQPTNIHVIRNGVLKSPYISLHDKGLELLNRSLKSMTVQQARGDLYRMLYYSEVNNYDLSFTYIDDKFDAEPATKKMFDQQYMEALYQNGYDKAVNNNLWQNQVPY